MTALGAREYYREKGRAREMGWNEGEERKGKT